VSASGQPSPHDAEITAEQRQVCSRGLEGAAAGWRGWTCSARRPGARRCPPSCWNRWSSSHRDPIRGA